MSLLVPIDRESAWTVSEKLWMRFMIEERDKVK